jgi:hypothetical protein
MIKQLRFFLLLHRIGNLVVLLLLQHCATGHLRNCISDFRTVLQDQGERIGLSSTTPCCLGSREACLSATGSLPKYGRTKARRRNRRGRCNALLCEMRQSLSPEWSTGRDKHVPFVAVTVLFATNRCFSLICEFWHFD